MNEGVASNFSKEPDEPTLESVHLIKITNK
jgi:hypothetical protein